MRRDPTAEYKRVEQLIAEVRERSKRVIVLAKYASKCDECGRTIEAGAPIAWRKSARAVHAQCWKGEVRHG